VWNAELAQENKDGARSQILSAKLPVTLHKAAKAESMGGGNKPTAQRSQMHLKSSGEA
jgi:hypothetical protein